MKAAVLNERNAPLEIEEVQIDKPGPREVLIRTAASGVCHSDLHLIGLWSSKYGPIVPGHEPAGIVEAVGDDVTYAKPGDRVIACLSVFCGICEFCTGGQSHLCGGAMFDRGRKEAPRLSRDGTPVSQMSQISSFAEQMLVPENALVHVPEEMPLDGAALIGCGVTTGLGAALYRARVEAGSTCVVVGCGGVGLSIIQGCRIAGATRIIAVDTSDAKLELAKDVGATDGVNGKSSDAVGEVKELTHGGVDYGFEAVGHPATARQTFDMVRKGGTAVMVGVMQPKDEFILTGQDLVMNEKAILGSTMGSMNFRVSMPRFIDLYLGGQLKLDEIISKRCALDEVNVCLDQMREGVGARSVIVFDA